jgi:hypothetical protein
VPRGTAGRVDGPRGRREAGDPAIRSRLQGCRALHAVRTLSGAGIAVLEPRPVER